MVNPQEAGGQRKTHKLLKQEWAAISQDVAQKLIDSMPGWIAEVLKNKGQHCKYWLLNQFHVIVNKSL